jgi:hypothetical protein
MKPKFSDLITYINKALTGNDWNTNWQKIVNWLTLGTYDLKVNKIETNEIENSGSFQANQVIADNVQANTIQSNNFVGNGANLTDIKVSNIFAYTPFCVNSAKDSFIDITDTSKLVFLVDDGTLYKPLIVTTAKGKQIKIISINDYDVSGLNGTYYIFVDEETNGGTVYLKSCTIFRQTTEPTGQNGDIWLDVSNEPFVCREKVSNNWYSDEYNKVPVGKVVISGGTITDLTILPFNNDGYHIVTRNDMTPDLSTQTSVLNTDTQYTERAIWLQITTSGNDMGSTRTIKAGVTSDNLNVTLYSQYYTGASVTLTFWILVPAKTYFKLSSTSNVSELNKYELTGNKFFY